METAIANTASVTMSSVAYATVRRPRVDIRSAFDHVADAAHRRDEPFLLLRVDLLAQMRDHDVDDVGARIEVISPGILGGQRVENLEARFPWQPHVEEDEVVRLRRGAALPFLAVGDQVGGVSLLLEPALHVLADGRIVLDHEYAHTGS